MRRKCSTVPWFQMDSPEQRKEVATKRGGARQRHPWLLCVALVVTLSLCHSVTLSLAAPVGPVLVTEGEAMLQDAPTLKGPGDEVSDGPRITILSPQEGKAYTGPVDIEVLFEQVPGGPGVRTDTLRVVYVKLWEIDITERLLPYLQANRLYVEHAQIPPGKHLFRVSIADQAGKTSARVVRVIVQ